jgi:hypothetical protein
MRGDSDDLVTLVAKSILTAIAADAAQRDFAGSFTLDDFLRAWIEYDSDFIDLLPDPPGRKNRSATQARTYWFYEGCHQLEETARIAEVGDGKFVVASLSTLMARARDARVEPSAAGGADGRASMQPDGPAARRVRS